MFADENWNNIKNNTHICIIYSTFFVLIKNTIEIVISWELRCEILFIPVKTGMDMQYWFNDLVTGILQNKSNW